MDDKFMDEFMIRIMGQNARDAAHGFEQSAKYWEERARWAEARMYLSEAQVLALFDGPYVPSERALREAVWPTQEDIALRITAQKQEEARGDYQPRWSE